MCIQLYTCIDAILMRVYASLTAKTRGVFLHA
jgi:hypothetical protein